MKRLSDGFAAEAGRFGLDAPQREMGAGIAASPHLRRALDLPVFISSGPKALINDPGAPAQASDFHQTAP